ncbi:hypothetical protein [Ramlibacter montanisoli]|uniref:hypothetical protein n=1 Tax=Ramlibacter montanisoli TaxID=2732512 RepID=UPI00209C1A17|nr:hypothetical protein [Ramlibacter montanisoli]
MPTRTATPTHHELEQRRSAAHHFLDGLVEAGIEHLFSNFGTDHVSLIEAMAQFAREGGRSRT